MLLILIVWFILTGNTEMSLFPENVHSGKGKSKHLDKRRWLFPNSPSARHIVEHWQLKKGRRRSKFLHTNGEIQMPYRTFKNSYTYKQAKPEYVKKYKYAAIYPKKMYKKSKVESTSYQQFLSKLNQSKNNKHSELPIKYYEGSNAKTNLNNLVINDNLNSKPETRRMSSLKQDMSKRSFAMYLENKRKHLISPSSSDINFASNDKNVINYYPQYLPRMTSINHIVRKPKYLPLPAIFPLTKKKTSSSISPFIKTEKSIVRKPKYLPIPPFFPFTKTKDSPDFRPLAKTEKSIVRKPKYLPIPPFFPFTKTNDSPAFRSLVKTENAFIFPSNHGILEGYNQSAAKFPVSTFTSPSQFRLFVPDQNKTISSGNKRRQSVLLFTAGTSVRSAPNYYIPTKDKIQVQINKHNKSSYHYPRELSRTATVSHKAKKTKFLTLPPFLQYTMAKISSTAETETPFIPIPPPESEFLPKNYQPAAGLPQSNLTFPNNSGLTVPVKNRYNASKQKNLFENKSKFIKPFLSNLPEETEQILEPLDRLGNVTFQQQPDVFQAQNVISPKNIPEIKPHNISSARFLNQTTHKFYTYDWLTSSTTMTSLSSTEMSSLQFLHHKLKQIKGIHDRLGRNEKILIASVSAVLTIMILTLILVVVYRRHKNKMKKKYPLQKKNTYTLLRAKKLQQEKLLKRISRLKYGKLKENDLES